MKKPSDIVKKVDTDPKKVTTPAVDPKKAVDLSKIKTTKPITTVKDEKI